MTNGTSTLLYAAVNPDKWLDFVRYRKPRSRNYLTQARVPGVIRVFRS
jgi:hypothetical protein